jgi:hypothetical protein
MRERRGSLNAFDENEREYVIHKYVDAEYSAEPFYELEIGTQVEKLSNTHFEIMEEGFPPIIVGVRKDK